MNIPFLILSPLLALSFALLATAGFRLKVFTAAVLAVFIMAYGQIVLTSRITSAFYLLSSHSTWLVVQTLLTGAALFVWWLQGKPYPPFPHLTSLNRAHVIHTVRCYPYLWILGIGVLSVYIIGAGIILYVPPNNWDGMIYRLSRAVYWLQFDTFMPWHERNIRLVSFPQNAEIGLLWTLLMRGTSQLAGFIQWGSALIGAVSVYAMARLLEFSKPYSIFAALIWLTLPQILLQSSTIQNDIVVSVFFTIALYFLYFSLKFRQHSPLLLSGFALGLAIGTKATVFFALPGLAVIALLLFLQQPKARLKPLVWWSGLCVAGFALFGAFTFITNQLAYGNPLGDERIRQIHIVDSEDGTLMTTLSNVMRYTYQFVDSSGIPRRLSLPLVNAKANLFDRLDQFHNQRFLEHYRSHIFANEDTSWFGVLGVVLLIPGIAYATWSGLTQRDLYMLGLVIIATLFLFSHSAIQEWTPYKGRYYILPVTIAASLMGWPMKSIRGGLLLRWMAVVTAIIVIVIVTLNNQKKPLVGENAVYRLDAMSRQLIISPPIEDFLREFEALVPHEAAVVLFISDNDWIYPYFGAEHTRYLIPYIPSEGVGSLEEIANTKMQFPLNEPPVVKTIPSADFIIVSQPNMRRISDTSGFEIVVDSGGMYLFARSDTGN